MRVVHLDVPLSEPEEAILAVVISNQRIIDFDLSILI